MEENLNIDELNAILTAYREQKAQDKRFMAALKGIDLDKAAKESSEDAFERVKRKAEARLTGKSEDEVEFSGLGFGVEIE